MFAGLLAAVSRFDSRAQRPVLRAEALLLCSTVDETRRVESDASEAAYQPPTNASASSLTLRPVEIVVRAHCR